MQNKTSKFQDDEVGSFPKERPLGFKVRTNPSFVFSVHVNEEIKDASYYSEVFDMMLEAGEDDSINFFISSPGGDINGLNILLEGIRLTEAHVTAIIVGEAHSAASILALNCHEVVVTDSATMLVHNLRTGYAGKIADLEAYTVFTRKTSSKLIDETYKGFLSDEDLQLVLHGKELWLESAEIQERLNNRLEYLVEKMEGEKIEAAKSAEVAGATSVQSEKRGSKGTKKQQTSGA